jgi:hypothetical protein
VNAASLFRGGGAEAFLMEKFALPSGLTLIILTVTGCPSVRCSRMSST